IFLATSIDAERAFSRGRLTVSHLHHSLSDESIRVTTVFGSWARISELVPEKHVIALLGGKKGPVIALEDDLETEPEGKLIPDNDDGLTGTASSTVADNNDFEVCLVCSLMICTIAVNGIKQCDLCIYVHVPA
ncbi:hypothetical protein C8Q80DRAFT_1107444, partial [Daedaleopsis nitida]